MNTVYKITNQSLQTHNGFQWELNKQVPELPDGGRLCSNKFYHGYSSQLLAVLLNPIHADIANPRLFEAEGFGESLDDRGLKVGYKSMILKKEIELPEVTLVNRIAFGILCALEVTDDESFKTWAENWLNGTDRSEEARAAAASWAEARAAAASWAADAEAEAAALWAAAAGTEKWAALWAARAAEWAAVRAARAAEWAAATTSKQINLTKLAEEAMKIR